MLKGLYSSEIGKIGTVYSPDLIIGHSKFKSGIDIRLLTRQQLLLINDKINQFRKQFGDDELPPLDELVEFFGYDYFEEEIETAGICNFYDKELIVNENIEQYEDKLITITHELGHVFQSEFLDLEDISKLSNNVRVEQQCETISYYLFNHIYGSRTEKGFFDVYFSVDDIKWLSEYYEGLSEDDIFK